MIGHGNASLSDTERRESAAGDQEPSHASLDASAEEQFSSSQINHNSNTINNNNNTNRSTSPRSVADVLSSDDDVPPLDEGSVSSSSSDEDDGGSITSTDTDSPYMLRDNINTAHSRVNREVYVEILERMEAQRKEERAAYMSGSRQEIIWNQDDDDPPTILDQDGNELPPWSYLGTPFADITEAFLGERMQGMSLSAQNDLLLRLLKDQ